jgi:hypothetical protein
MTAPRERLPDPCSPNVQSVYDGTDPVGYIVRRGNVFHAITANGRPLGIFDSSIEAARAIPPRHREVTA